MCQKRKHSRPLTTHHSPLTRQRIKKAPENRASEGGCGRHIFRERLDGAAAHPCVPCRSRSTMHKTPCQPPCRQHRLAVRRMHKRRRSSIPMQTLHQQPQGCLSLGFATSATQAWRGRYATLKIGSSLIFFREKAAKKRRIALLAKRPGSAAPLAAKLCFEISNVAHPKTTGPNYAESARTTRGCHATGEIVANSRGKEVAPRLPAADVPSAFRSAATCPGSRPTLLCVNQPTVLLNDC